MSTPETLAAELERRVRKEQRDKRLPSLAAAVVRDGEVVWESAVGAAEVREGREATPDTQYRVGSITKSFTAAAVMQLRDAGQLDLEDSLEVHVEGAPHAPTLRRLLSHTSGLQRETHDEGWLRAQFAEVPELLDTLDRAEQVLPPGARFHYSNLAFALLGIVVDRVSGMPYRDYVQQRLLEPLGLTRTSFEPQGAATGYLVQPYVEGVWDEAPIETGAWIAAGQMWGTVRDLGRWASFLADPDETVLSKRTVEEMRTLQSIDDHIRWTSGYGLGLQLLRDGERVLAGHGGSMPGFIAGVFVSPTDKVGAAALTNSSSASVQELVKKLVSVTVDQWPVPPDPWQVEEPPPPDDVLELLGIWFLEGDQFTMRWRDGKLEARFPDDPDWKPSAVIRREDTDRWRVESGWEQGELVRVERDGEGHMTRLVLAGYPVTRQPTAWL